jgi:hypothetical protein
MTQENKKPSEYITEFLNFISDVKSSYSYCYEEMQNQDKLTQDYLHMIELEDLKYEERNKIATKLVTNRKDRRYFKDRVEEYEPIVNFLADPKTKDVFKKLQQVLGTVRKVEGYHKDRFYVPKVLKEGEVQK